jgi:translation initiation factor 6 (eIF-6)
VVGQNDRNAGQPLDVGLRLAALVADVLDTAVQRNLVAHIRVVAVGSVEGVLWKGMILNFGLKKWKMS